MCLFRKKFYISTKNHIRDLINSLFINSEVKSSYSKYDVVNFISLSLSSIEEKINTIKFELAKLKDVDFNNFTSWISKFNNLKDEVIKKFACIDTYAGYEYCYLTDSSIDLIINIIQEINSSIGELSLVCAKEMNKSKIDPTPNTIFIVHGHNYKLRDSIERALRKKYDVKILEKIKKDGSINIIDKFIKYGNLCSKAIILLTKDDDGINNPDKMPRSNVCIEFGYFLSILRKEDIIFIKDDVINCPSDINGITYLKYEPNDKNFINKLISALEH